MSLSRPALLLVPIAWLGATLVLDRVSLLRSRDLAARLSRHRPGHRPDPRATTLREVVLPLLDTWGRSLAATFGVRDDLATRLERAGSTETPPEYRVRQAGWTAAGLLGGALLTVALRPPLVLAVTLPLGGALLGFLLVEQRLSAAAEVRQRAVAAEAAVVAEQLGMLLSAGFSLGTALTRLAERTDGAIATDLRDVVRRVRQGSTELEALSRWARVVDVDAVRRLVAVLSLHRVAGDLGPLIAQEARIIRADSHRELLASIERRAQHVWIPVTVATLVPGVLLLAVPFLDALGEFGRL